MCDRHVIVLNESSAVSSSPKQPLKRYSLGKRAEACFGLSRLFLLLAFVSGDHFCLNFHSSDTFLSYTQFFSCTF